MKYKCWLKEYELESDAVTVNADSPEEAAEQAAEDDFYQDGWERDWHLKWIVIDEENKWFEVEVEREAVPQFLALMAINIDPIVEEE